MKKLLSICLFFCCICTAVFAKDFYNIDAIKQRAFDAPDNLSKQKLTKYLVKPFKDDYEKVQVIAYWIASHIAYDGYKYNGTINIKEMSYNYDTYEFRTGICEDYAKLFEEMAQIAGIDGVIYVDGYVLETPTRMKKLYTQKEIDAAKGGGHAWNEVFLDKRKFFVDTTYMAETTIGLDSRPSTFRHKMDIKRRGRHRHVNTEINDFYSDFTPKQEMKKYRRLHVLDKYIKGRD